MINYSFNFDYENPPARVRLLLCLLQLCGVVVHIIPGVRHVLQLPKHCLSLLQFPHTLQAVHGSLVVLCNTVPSVSTLSTDLDHPLIGYFTIITVNLNIE